MKTKITLLVLFFFSIIVYGQFPQPTNFNYSHAYFDLLGGGPCGGSFVNGPSYCSYFSWNTPDTSLTSSSLSYYKVHYKRDSAKWGGELDTFYVTTDTLFEIELGIMGWVWVTAVYINPSGESDSSNVQYSDELETSIKETNIDSDIKIQYLPNEKVVMIETIEEIQLLNIYNTYGTCVKTTRSKSKVFSVANLKSGMYLIELITTNKTTSYSKIIIN